MSRATVLVRICPLCLPRRVLPGSPLEFLDRLADLEPPPGLPALGSPTDWGELVQVHDDLAVFQTSPDELPTIDLQSL